ncbi:MAG: response regulator, partial [Candidatus Aureabacteria bacterium]|nr:response regulator [Candidatus Auribacterota bacterium]
MRILIVEDDARTASFVMKGLKQACFVVDHAIDGVAGLQQALTHPYDAAVIDIMLPGMDGLALVSELRARKIK